MSYHTATELAQIGNHKDKQTGAVSTPIHLSTTFAHPGLGKAPATITHARKIRHEKFWKRHWQN